MIEDINNIFKESIEVKQQALEANREIIIEVVSAFKETLLEGGKLIFFGNGGSAADSQHIAAEFVGRFQKERKALAAIALTTDSSILTALGNDYSFDIVFARQLEALGRAGDIAFGISTSGQSKNVIEAMKVAKSLGIKTVSLTGKDGGALAAMTDMNINVPSEKTARIQESHLCIIHSICELVENHF